MGRTAFTSENKVAKGTDLSSIPRLKLKKDQRVRIAILEDPVSFYTHRLQAPKMVNGVPAMETKERRDKTKYDDYVYDFLSSPRCLGDDAILRENGADSKNCPMCDAAKRGSTVDAPRRRHALNVVRYITKPSSIELAVPYQVAIEVWAFTDKRFDQLVEIVASWGGLNNNDLVFGPCTNELFQNFEISVQPQAVWQSSTETKQKTALAFKENRFDDDTLGDVCGQLKERRWIDSDLEKIEDRWHQVKVYESGAVAPTGDSLTSTSLEADLSGLLESGAGGQSAPAEPQEAHGFAPAAQGGTDFGALLADTSTPVSTEPPADQQPEPVSFDTPSTEQPGDQTSSLLADSVAPAEPEPVTEEKPAGGAMSFADLLNQA